MEDLEINHIPVNRSGKIKWYLQINVPQHLQHFIKGRRQYKISLAKELRQDRTH